MPESKLERESQRYKQHHTKLRDDGELVFVPERLALFKRHVGGPGKDVLDLGCRTGAVTQHYVEGNNVVGIGGDRGRAGLAKCGDDVDALTRAREQDCRHDHGG